MLIGIVTDAVENEEFRLGTEVSGIGDAGRSRLSSRCCAGRDYSPRG